MGIKTGYFISAIFLLSLVKANGQSIDSTTSKPELSFSSLINLNRELSYVTFTEGLTKNVSPLVFELKIAPSYFFTHKQSLWALELNMSILLRMLRESSLPIRTPSYMPSLNFHKKIKRWQTGLGNRIFFDQAFWTLSFNHHSNGQDGLFIDETTGKINTNNGSFSSNYFQLGITSFDYLKIGENEKFMSLNLHIDHYPSWPFKMYSKEIKDSYGLTRFFVTYNTYNLPSRTNLTNSNKRNEFFRRSRVRLKTGWIFGHLDGANTFDVDNRLIVEGTYIYHPNFLDEMALFAQVYRGQDYYNIHFFKEVTMLRIGLISDPLIFRSISNIFKHNDN